MASRTSQGTSNSRTAVPRLNHRAPRRRGFGAWVGRVVARACALPLVPVATVGLLALTGGFYQYVNYSPYFELQSVQINGTDRLPAEQVRVFLENQEGVVQGVSLVKLDPEQLEQRLTALPEVARVHVRRIWPDQLSVEIEERRHKGVYISRSGSMVFDEQGFLFAEARVSDFLAATAPILTGMDDEAAPEIGKRLAEKPFLTAMQYAAAIGEASPSLAQRISEFHWSNSDGLTVVLDDGARLRCGNRPVQETGPVIESLLAHAAGRRMEYANLLPREHVAVRWLEAPPPVETNIAHRGR